MSMKEEIKIVRADCPACKNRAKIIKELNKEHPVTRERLRTNHVSPKFRGWELVEVGAKESLNECCGGTMHAEFDYWWDAADVKHEVHRHHCKECDSWLPKQGKKPTFYSTPHVSNDLGPLPNGEMLEIKPHKPRVFSGSSVVVERKDEVLEED